MSQKWNLSNYSTINVEAKLHKNVERTPKSSTHGELYSLRFVIQDQSTHSGYIRPHIVLYQEELRAHCISVRSDNFILAPHRSQGTTTMDFVHLNDNSFIVKITHSSELQSDISSFIYPSAESSIRCKQNETYEYTEDSYSILQHIDHSVVQQTVACRCIFQTPFHSLSQ